VGIDLGIRYSAVTSEGKFYRYPSFNARKRKLRYLKRCLQSKETHSARKHLRKLRHREQNMNRAQCHLLANAILRDAKGDVLVLEDLTKIKRKKGFENKNAISQVPFYLLKTVLQYKAPDFGKTVITVSPHYTSQIDHRNGLKTGVRKGMRYTCSDGVVLHADFNASINIRNRWNDPTMVKTKKPKTPKVYRRGVKCSPSTPILLEYTKVCPSTNGQVPVTEPIVVKSCES
jgi:IS605 OrfB family transposase